MNVCGLCDICLADMKADLDRAVGNERLDDILTKWDEEKKEERETNENTKEN